MALCGMVPIGGCDLDDLTHSGPCVVGGRLTKTGRRTYGIRSEEIAREQIEKYEGTTYEVVFED